MIRFPVEHGKADDQQKGPNDDGEIRPAKAVRELVGKARVQRANNGTKEGTESTAVSGCLGGLEEAAYPTVKNDIGMNNCSRG